LRHQLFHLSAIKAGEGGLRIVIERLEQFKHPDVDHGRQLRYTVKHLVEDLGHLAEQGHRDAELVGFARVLEHQGKGTGASYDAA